MKKRNVFNGLDDKTLHVISATIFSVATLVHLIRLVYGFPLVIGSWYAPMSASWIGLLIGLALSWLLWKSAMQ